MQIHSILAAVSLVLQMNGTDVVGNASGFFFQIDSDKYFATNRHVVDPPPQSLKPGEKPKPRPETLRLRLHTNPQNLQQNDWLDLPLYDKASRTKRWKVHPCVDADLALVPLVGTDLSRFQITWLSPAEYLPSNLALHPGEDVFIIGYPEGLHDHIHNLPILRNALIASAYGAPFQGKPYFLTDARLHPGTSGSPVFTKPKNTWVDTKGQTLLTVGTSYFLVGVHAGTVIWPPNNQGPDPLGLGVAWYARLLTEIAAQPKCQQ